MSSRAAIAATAAARSRCYKPGMAWHRHIREGDELAVLDYGGDGVPVILLHGLAGHAEEWVDTATHQIAGAHVLAPDARGHGRSVHLPKDVSRKAHADDVAFLVEDLDLDSAILVGQSLGGQTALLVAAKRPDLVRGLVMVEAGPDRGTEDATAEVEEFLSSWPRPFPTREAAERFFGGPSLRATRWADGLEVRGGGLWPRFEVEVMMRTLREATESSCWDDWGAIQCPTLVVTAHDGILSVSEKSRMKATHPRARWSEIAGAGHDLHLENPDAWNRVLDVFIRNCD
jgi:pimeloyl-ACP methyl ester carboxylesterase